MRLAPAPDGVSKSRGFTLVELLVVIAIISVLAAMLLPALEGAVRSARTIACANTTKQAFVAVSLFADNNRNWIPSTVAWRNASGAKINDWNQADTRALPYFEYGQQKAGWQYIPYHTGSVTSNSNSLGSQRPHGWGILVAEGYVDDVRGTLYCPSRYSQNLGKNHFFNGGAYDYSWQGKMPANNQIDITPASYVGEVSYYHMRYGRMDRIFKCDHNNWSSNAIPAASWPLAYEMNGVYHSGWWLGSMVVGRGPSQNGHSPGVTTLFFDGHVRFLPDEGNLLEVPGNQWTDKTSDPIDWVQERLDLGNVGAWKPTGNPGRGARDNIDTYHPLYQAGQRIFP